VQTTRLSNAVEEVTGRSDLPQVERTLGDCADDAARNRLVGQRLLLVLDARPWMPAASASIRLGAIRECREE